MAESREDMDALLAEAGSVAASAVAEITAAPPAPSQRPAAASRATAGHASPPPAGVTSDDSSPRRNIDLRRILALEVPVIVKLAEKTSPLAEILNLTTGAILEFDKPFDGELELMINNQVIGFGQAVKVGENFGLRVTRIGSVRTRIQAMGVE